MKTLLTLMFITLLSFQDGYTQKAGQKIHQDFISNSKGNLSSTLIVSSDSATSITLSIACYRKNATTKDSLLVYSKVIADKKLRKGVQTILFDFSKSSKETFIHPVFKQVLSKYDLVAPGNYVTYIVAKDNATNNNATEETYHFYNDFDSTLSLQSPLKKVLINKIAKLRNTASDKDVEKVSIAEGLTHTRKIHGNNLDYDFYFDNWFVGRYRINATQKIQEQAKKEKELITSKANTLIQGAIENTQSLQGKFKELSEKGKEDAEITGGITLSANLSNQQDAFSSQDRNFYEVIGNLELPIMGIPVGVEAYFTTQDLNRKIKSSYIRMHYDVSKAKEELLHLMTDYKNQYKQVEGNAGGMSEIYTNYLKNITSQKDKLQSELKRKVASQTGEIPSTIDTTGLFSKMIDKLDSDTSLKKDKVQYQAKKDSLQKKYQEIQQKYEQAEALAQKVEKYEKLVQQYKNTNYFDSLMTYDKIKDLNDYEDMSYKDLSKRASSLLPNGKVKQVATGITNFDVGMFSKYTNKYTQAGQQLKGVNVGYDIGVATTSITTGKVEYIGRDGSLDKFSSYGVSVQLKPIKKQKIAFDYFGYSPSKKAISTDKEFFKDINTEYPSFQRNTNIISLSYEGELVKHIHLMGDMATSVKKQAEQKLRFNTDALAYNIGLEADIPKTNISTVLSYENIGKDFENNTLPFNRSGTERYSARIKNQFFKNYLQVGVEYNYFIQHNLLSNSQQTKWGFDIKTQSKRYPNIAVSFKPFSTIRTFADTLNTPLRPLLGEVWTSKLSYQYKKHGRVWRFMAIYNKSNSKQDTTSYRNDLLQASIAYTEKKLTTNLTIGSMKMQSSTQEYIPSWHRNKSYQVGINLSYSINKKVQTNTGFDVAFSNSLVYSTGLNGGLTYRMEKIPIQYRFYARYNRYQLMETLAWQNRISGVIDISWQFKYKLYEKK